jgi:hypothetical protein
MVRILRRGSRVLSLACWLANAAAVIIVVALTVRLAGVDDAIHAFVAFGVA